MLQESFGECRECALGLAKNLTDFLDAWDFAGNVTLHHMDLDTGWLVTATILEDDADWDEGAHKACKARCEECNQNFQNY